MAIADHVQREVVLPVPPEEAWDALVRPSELESWLAEEVDSEGDLEAGSSAVFTLEDGDVRHVVVEDVEEPRRVAWRWSPDGDDESTLVELTLEELPDGEGSILRVVESGFEALSVEARTIRVATATGWGPRMQACGSHMSALALV